MLGVMVLEAEMRRMVFPRSVIGADGSYRASGLAADTADTGRLSVNCGTVPWEKRSFNAMTWAPSSAQRGGRSADANEAPVQDLSPPKVQPGGALWQMLLRRCALAL